MSDDIVELQSRIVDLEKQLHELSDVVADQWKIIDALKGSLVQQKDRIIALESAKGKKDDGQNSIDEARDNIPPHY